jgi:hypothetical protein
VGIVTSRRITYVIDFDKKETLEQRIRQFRDSALMMRLLEYTYNLAENT